MGGGTYLTGGGGNGAPAAPAAAAAAAVTTDGSSFVAFGEAAGVGPAPAAFAPAARDFLSRSCAKLLLMASDAKASAGQTATPPEFAPPLR